ncbi:MAG: hypothetical protein ACI308_07580 [Muribaculaceae bacterium]
MIHPIATMSAALPARTASHLCQATPDVLIIIVVVFIVIVIGMISFILLYRYMMNTIAQLRRTIRISNQNHARNANEAHAKIIEAIPKPIAFYDNTGRCIYINESCKKLIDLQDAADVPNLFESRILSISNANELRQGKDISDMAFLNYTDNTTMLFGKKISHKLAIRYKIQAIFNLHGDISNYVLAIDDFTKEYAQKQNAEEYLSMLRDCLQMTGIKAYYYDVQEDMYYKYINNAFSQTGMNAESVFKHIAPLYRAQYIEMFLHMKSGEIVTDRRRYPMFSSVANRYYYVETFTYGVTDVSGNVTKIVQTMRNVTDNQEKLLQLDIIKLIISAILPQAGISTWFFDIDKKMFTLYIKNQTYYLPQNDILSRIHPEDQEKFLAAINRIINDKQQSAHIAIRTNGQSVNWQMHELYAQPKRNDSGVITHVMGINCDVSRSHEIESSFHQIVEKIRTLVNISQTWVCDYNIPCRKLMCSTPNNSAMKQHSQQAILKFVAEHHKAVVGDIIQKINDGKLDRFEQQIDIVDTKGNYQRMEIRGKAYEYCNGKPTKIIAYVKTF